MELARLLLFGLGVYLSGVLFSWLAARALAWWRGGLAPSTAVAAAEPGFGRLEQDLELRRKELGEAREALDRLFGGDPSPSEVPVLQGENELAAALSGTAETAPGEDPLADAWANAEAAAFLAAVGEGRASHDDQVADVEPPALHHAAASGSEAASAFDRARLLALQTEAAELAPLRARLLLLSKRLEALERSEHAEEAPKGVSSALAAGVLRVVTDEVERHHEKHLRELQVALEGTRLEAERWRRSAESSLSSATEGFRRLDREVQAAAAGRAVLEREAQEAREALAEAQELLGRALELVQPAVGEGRPPERSSGA